MEKPVHIGDKIDFEKDTENFFSITFLPLDVFDDWERGSKLSNFIADYYLHDFSSETDHNLISTVFNELIENAVKFSRNNSFPIEVVAKKRHGNLLAKVTNTLPKHRRDPFMNTCRDLFNKDLEELYLKRIEDGIEDESASGIGLILIKKDYESCMRFDFFTDDSNNAKVSVTMDIAVNQG